MQKPPAPDLKKASLGSADDVAVGVLLELEAEGRVRIVRRGLMAQRDVIRGDELLVLPLALVQQAIGEAHRIGGVERSAAGAVGVRHVEIAALQAIAPRGPSPWAWRDAR